MLNNSEKDNKNIERKKSSKTATKLKLNPSVKAEIDKKSKKKFVTEKDGSVKGYLFDDVGTSGSIPEKSSQGILTIKRPSESGESFGIKISPINCVILGAMRSEDQEIKLKSLEKPPGMRSLKTVGDA